MVNLRRFPLQSPAKRQTPSADLRPPPTSQSESNKPRPHPSRQPPSSPKPARTLFLSGTICHPIPGTPSTNHPSPLYEPAPITASHVSSESKKATAFFRPHQHHPFDTRIPLTWCPKHESRGLFMVAAEATVLADGGAGTRVVCCVEINGILGGRRRTLRVSQGFLYILLQLS